MPMESPMSRAVYLKAADVNSLLAALEANRPAKTEPREKV